MLFFCLTQLKSDPVHRPDGVITKKTRICLSYPRKGTCQLQVLSARLELAYHSCYIHFSLVI